MPGATGQQKYIKYFSSQDRVKTVLKSPQKESYIKAFDVAMKGKSVLNGIQLQKGKEIEYINEGEYVSKALIDYDGKLYRVKFDQIEKPKGKGGTAGSLKPKYFPLVVDKKLTRDKYITNLIQNIDERADLNPKVALYLKELTYVVSGESANTSQLKKIYTEHLNTIKAVLKDINKDFAELLGPLYLMNDNPLQTAKNKVDIKKTHTIFLPEAANYPLVDFMCGPTNNMFQFSSKVKGSTTNVVKPADLLPLLKPDISKWRNTDQYKIFEILNKSSMASGSAMVGKYLLKKGYTEYEGLPDKLTDADLKSTRYDKDKFADFISNNESLSEKGDRLRATMITYFCDKLLEKISKSGYRGSKPRINFTKIFSSAISNKVIYVTYKTNLDGTPNFGVLTDEDFETSDVYLRTKNYNTGLSDKMGIQI